ncbi:MAG: DUF4268 domain-containing protein [Legionella sp.]|uniref:DUF4268 domain-containing protein n=1 Tax=Legionella sp. TaxID=459 RepID=UPI002851ABBD|nr:DUF4268 domain-containing protein [Legionella sp.]
MILSKLVKVDLREVWKHEAVHFTQWLANADNLAILSEEIGIDISLVQTEASVGSFNVDILAEEVNTGRKIVIENQLESSDHDHLGKIITYASGYDAEIIIWIVKNVRDEHKQAIDWLNEHTDEKINIFAIQMEVWKISDSPYAPKFQIIAKPNDWAKAVKKASSQSDLSDIKLMQLEFWSKFKEYVSDKNKSIKLRKPRPQQWYDISFGNSNAQISLNINSLSNQLVCEIYIMESKPLFSYLHSEKEQIEKELSCELQWNELPNKKASRIKAILDANIRQEDNWNDYFQWLLSNVESFQKVFSKYIKQSGI